MSMPRFHKSLLLVLLIPEKKDQAFFLMFKGMLFQRLKNKEGLSSCAPGDPSISGCRTFGQSYITVMGLGEEEDLDVYCLRIKQENILLFHLVQ